MSLKYLKAFELDEKMKSLASKEREILVELLVLIKEIDSRKIYLDLGFSSLFAYLTEGVGYSEGSAQRRIDAARLLKEIPEITKEIQDGRIKLNQISMLQRASREIRKTGEQSGITSQQKSILLQSLVSKNHRDSQKEIATFFDLPVVHEQKILPQKDNSVRVEISLTEDQYKSLEKAQELLSHSIGSKELADFLQYVCDKIIKQKTDSRKNSNCHSSEKSEGSKKIVKNIPTTIRKHVLKRDQCCQYIDKKTGKRCNSRWFLQVDHKQSVWSSSLQKSSVLHSIDNLQLLCANHNKMKYRREAGLLWKS